MKTSKNISKLEKLEEEITVLQRKLLKKCDERKRLILKITLTRSP